MNAPAPTKPRATRAAQSSKTAAEPTAKTASKANPKSRAAAKALVAAKGKEAVKAARPAREKYVKGSYKIPKADYALFAVLKERAAATVSKPRKNDLIRAGLQALMDSGRVELRRALDRLPSGKI